MPRARSTCRRSRASTSRSAAAWPPPNISPPLTPASASMPNGARSAAVAELREVRNVKPGFKRGLWLGLLNAGIESMFGGRTPWTLRNTASYPLEKLADYESPNRHWKNRDLPPRDRLSSVFYAVTAHDEVQPAHLHVRDRNICATTCATEYGNRARASAPPRSTRWSTTTPAARSCTSTRPTACTARPATSRTRTRSSTG